MLRIETIGRCVAYVGERRIDPSAEMVFAALMYFGLERGRTHGRSDVAQLFWPDAPPNVQRTRLRWLLAKLRSLGLAIDAPDSRLGFASSCVSIDFTDIGDLAPQMFGAVMGSYAPEFSPNFTSWLNERRDAATTTVLRQLLPRLSSASRVGEWDSVLQIAEGICRVDPQNEEGVLKLAEAQCRLGARAQGLQTLERYLCTLGDANAQLGLQARLLEQRIRSIHSPTARFESRFVGRKEEMRLIDDLLRSARDGGGGAFVMSGPAGIGKTRLLDEAALRASMAGMQVVRVKCQRGDKMRPLSGIVDLVPALLDLRGALGCDPIKLECLRRLTRAADDSKDPGPAPVTNPAWRRAQIVDALRDLLDAASEEAPVLIQVDDVQWVERSLEWFWSSLVSWSRDRKVALLFALRTSHRTRPNFEVAELAVPALETEAAEQLLDDLLARNNIAGRIDRAAVLARGAGSPLFLRELVRHCASMGSADELPTSLVSMLDVGLSSLSRYALRVLQVAAILGKHATLERIEATARLSRSDFLDAVAELELAAILSSDVSGATTGHVLWSEAAIARLTANVSRLLHRHAAQQFEEEFTVAPRLTIAWECARHWEAAGDLARARTGTLAAAESLARNGFPDDAATAYARAIAWTIDPRERLRLLDRRLVLMTAAGYAAEIVQEVDAYDTLASEIDPSYDGHSHHELRKWRAYYLMTGDSRPQMENAFRCVQSPRSSLSHRLEAAKECALGAEFLSSDVLQTVFEIASALEPASSDDQWNRYVVEFLYHSRLGDPAQALAIAMHRLAAVRALGDRVRVTFALGHVGRCCATLGEFARAISAYAERIALGKQLGMLQEVRAGYDGMVAAYLDMGRVPEAATALREYRELAATAGSKPNNELSQIILRLHASQIAVMESRPEDVEILDLTDEFIAAQTPRCRVRVFAILLSAKLLAGQVREAAEYAPRLKEAFDEADGWLDWPAVVYANFLEMHRGAGEAAEFVNDYLERVRREPYAPPDELARWARPARLAVLAS